MNKAAFMFQINAETAVSVRVEHHHARRGGYSIRLDSDGLRIIVPPNHGTTEAERYLERHRRWIEKRFRERRDAESALPKIAEGEFVPLWGGSRKISQAPPDIESPSFTESEFLYPHSAAGNQALMANHLAEAYIHEAGKTLKTLLKHRLQEFAPLVKRVNLKEIKSRWGSCSAKGAISISWRLVMAPPEVLEYLLTHELCHLIANGHGPKFWNEVAKRSPNYQNAKKHLRQHHFKLMNFPFPPGPPKTFVSFTPR